MLFLSHLKGWELHPPSNYQLSSGWLSRCCPSPVFTVSDKRIALPDLSYVFLLVRTVNTIYCKFQLRLPT
jgi:hypothetical protein